MFEKYFYKGNMLEGKQIFIHVLISFSVSAYDLYIAQDTKQTKKHLIIYQYLHFWWYELMKWRDVKLRIGNFNVQTNGIRLTIIYSVIEISLIT